MYRHHLVIKKIKTLLQLLAVSYYLTEFGILICVYPFIFLFSFLTIFWPLSFAYLCWFIYDYGQDERGGRQFSWFKRMFFWKWASDYFPVKLIKTEDISPDRNYLFCLQPHGLFSLGTIFSLVTEGAGFQEKFRGLKQHILTVPAQVVTPIHREISMALGYVSASKKSLLYLLDKKKKGNVAMLMLGGAFETIYAYKNSMNICINNRKGFIKIALQTGAPLVPVIVFGRGLFTNYFGLLPFRVPINTVVGKPIEVEQTTNPTQQQIDALHKKYLDALNKLYEEYNPIYGNSNVKLNII